MSAYMRDRFPFYGLKKPARAALFKAHVAQYGLPADEAALHEAVRALREYSKEDGAAVRAFIANHDLAPLRAREGMKWLQRQK